MKDIIKSILEWYETTAVTKEEITRYVEFATNDGLIEPKVRRDIEWFVKTHKLEDCVC